VIILTVRKRANVAADQKKTSKQLKNADPHGSSAMPQ
jgi:hypothetical protein